MRHAAALWLALAGTAAAGPVDDLISATEGLDAARSRLEASLADDPLPALTGVVLAYDSALAALRATERETVIARAQSQAALDARGGELARVLAALSAAGGPTTAERVLHPGGPLGAARAAMLMAAAAPAMTARAEEARASLSDIAALDGAIAAAGARLEAGVAMARDARVALADRARAAAPFAPDETLRTIGDAAGSLQEVALAVAESPAGAGIGAPPPPGGWPLPVDGALLRGYMEPDAGGTPRPGLVIATAAGAILTAPAAMTVRYLGSLRGYGNVMILEPAPGYLLVLSGFADPLAAGGQVLAPGAPLAMMGQPQAASGQTDGADALTQTLYVETRVSGESADPAQWFELNKE